MITNARQYNATRHQLRRLENALHGATTSGPPPNIHPTIHAAELRAIASQADDLRDQLKAYDQLVSGETLILEATSLEALPEVLIKARIANGWSQQELADRLGVRAQQVQRDETTRYQSASLERLTNVADVLGVQLKQTATLSVQLLGRAESALQSLGFESDFVAARITASPEHGTVSGAAAGRAVDQICHVFGWTVDDLLDSAPPEVSTAAAGGALFKKPGGRKASYLDAYSAYAYRLACGAARSAAHLTRVPVPADASQVRKDLLKRGPLNLAGLLDWAWGHGVVVLVLRDKAAFHGAFWRIDGRNVIIMKQRTNSSARLMHDLLHELYHSALEPDRESRSVLDHSDYLQSKDEEEEAATAFASDVLLDGRANDLAVRVVRESAQQAPRFKSATVRIADEAGVSVGALANHLAWVLARQKTPFPWWGVAQNLQESADSDLQRAQELAFQRLTPPDDASVDVELLFRALRDQEV